MEKMHPLYYFIIVIFDFMTQQDFQISDLKTLISLCSIDDNYKENLIVNNSLIHIGKRNGVAAWCYSRIENSSKIPEMTQKYLKSWDKIFHESSRTNQTKLGVFLSIQEILLSADIPILALRGFAMSISSFEHLGQRPTGNLDIMVPEGKAMLALSVLINAGAQTVSAPRSSLHEKVQAHVRFITYKGVQIVIYQRLFSLGNPLQLKVDYFEHTQNVEIEGETICLLDDVFMGYHLVAYVAHLLDRERIRLSWLLDIALLFAKQEDLSLYLKRIRRLNPSQSKLFNRVFEMSLLFVPAKQNEYDIKTFNEENILQDVFKALKNRTSHSSYSTKLQFHDVMQVEGFKNKLSLVWRELFPSREYMSERYNREDEVLFGLYLKRLLGNW